jgi:hypothetical protein
LPLILSQHASLIYGHPHSFTFKLFAMQTTSTRTQGLLTLFDYQTGFFAKALAGMSEDDMHNRLQTEANHPAWLAGSLVHQRFQMASEMKHDLKQTRADLFEGHKGLQEGERYPTIEEYINDWNKITPIAREALVSIDDKKLDSIMDMGEWKMPYYEMISFTIYREASIIGQLALWRRLLGYPAMKYD